VCCYLPFDFWFLIAPLVSLTYSSPIFLYRQKDKQKPEIKGQTTTHWPTENRQKDKQKPEIKGQTTTHWPTENRQKDKQ
jgi:hypothetical protein